MLPAAFLYIVVFGVKSHGPGNGGKIVVGLLNFGIGDIDIYSAGIVKHGNGRSKVDERVIVYLYTEVLFYGRDKQRRAAESVRVVKFDRAEAFKIDSCVSE